MIKQKVIARTRALEEEARSTRIREGKTALGANRLRSQAIMSPHTPSPRERRVNVLTTIKQLRIMYIAARKEFTKRCRECYRALRDGCTSVAWPPGAIRPYVRPVTNAIVSIQEVLRRGPLDTEPIRVDVFQAVA